MIELSMSIEDYWKLENDLKEANYLMASGESSAEVSIAFRRILQQSLKHAVKEKDRNWIHEKLRSS